MIVVLFCSNIYLYSQVGSSEICCPTEPCDPNKKYPYKFCEYDDTYNIMRIVTRCTDDPNSMDNIIKVDLPIRINCPTSPNVAIFSNIYLSMAHALMPEFTNNDLITAANKWNCICGYGVDDEGGSTIQAEFSKDWRDFEDPYDDKSTYKNSNICNSAAGTIYFNNTSEFWDAKPSKDNPNQESPYGENPIYRVLLNEYLKVGWNWAELIRILNEKTNNSQLYYTIYSLVDVAMRQLGEILGMGWSGGICDCGTDDGSGRDAIMSPNWIGNILVHNVSGNSAASYFGLLGGKDNHSSGDCDKCMFQKLYCPDNDCPNSIYEYAPPNQNLYPNPASKTTSIEFTLPNYTDNLKMFIMNPIGQVILLVKENGIYDAGAYTELINIEGLSAGPYFLIIEAGSHRTVKPFIVTNY